MKNNQIDDTLVGNTRELGPRVRVIDTRDDILDEHKNRILSEKEAHLLRMESGLDLIVVNPDIDPPVAKLIDFGKYKYEQSKKMREHNRAQRESQRGVKEFYFTPKIETHDYRTKLNRIKTALDKGHDVRIGIKLDRAVRMSLPRGKNLLEASREDDFILKRVIEDLSDSIQPTELSVQKRLVTAILRKA